MSESIWLFLGAALTLLVILGYLIGENNVLFRLATYLFVGVSAGYIFVVVIYQVLIPRIVLPLLSTDVSQNVMALVPLALGILLLFKLSPRLSGIGTVPMAYLVGVGAAVAIGGAVLGTLLTQSQATINLFDLRAAGSVQPALRLVDGLFVLVGTLSTLAYFHFGSRSRAGGPPERAFPVTLAARIGQIFIAITLGALFAGVFTAALTALMQRVDFLWNVLRTLIG